MRSADKLWMVCIRVKRATGPRVQVSFEPIFVGVHVVTISSASLTFLSPSFSFSLFGRALCLQRRRHLWFAPWCIVSGYARACSDPRNIRDTCRLSPPSWHRFSLPRRECIRHQALKIGSNVLDEAFSVRAIPPLLLSGALSLSLSLDLQSRAGPLHFRCIYASMHRMHRRAG